MSVCAVCLVLVGVVSGVLIWRVMLDTQELYKHQLHGKIWFVENNREYTTFTSKGPFMLSVDLFIYIFDKIAFQ